MTRLTDVQSREMTPKAYGVGGFHYCENCYSNLFEDDENWPSEELFYDHASFRGTLTFCEECGEEIFGHDHEFLEERIYELKMLLDPGCQNNE